MVRHQLGLLPSPELSYEFQQHQKHEAELAKQRNVSRSAARKSVPPPVLGMPLSEIRRKKKEAFARKGLAEAGRVNVHGDLVLKLTTLTPVEFEAVVSTTTRDTEVRKALARGRRAERSAVGRWKAAIDLAVDAAGKAAVTFVPADDLRAAQTRKDVARMQGVAEKKGRDRGRLWEACTAERGGLEHGALDGMLGMKWVTQEVEGVEAGVEEKRAQATQALAAAARE
eukprot:3442724-Rhodomonas_salina.1